MNLHNVLSVLILGLMFVGINYLIFVDDSDKLIQLGAGLLWGLAFHFVAIRFKFKKYMFSPKTDNKD